MTQLSQKIPTLIKRDGIVWLAALLFCAIMFTLQVQQHNAFNSRIGDFARFSQAIWSVLDGHFLYTPIPGRSILGDHFSPLMVIAAPILLIWPDERALFLVQAINVTASGLILYYAIRPERPSLAPWLALAFFLNADVHEFILIDFRRIMFGLPWLCLAMVGLVRKDRKLLLIGLLIALLAKETVALYIAMIGFYLIVVERDWKWGTSLFLFGGFMLIFLSEVVIPAFGGGVGYPQLFYYNHIGGSYSEIITNILSDPISFIQLVFGPEQRFALFRVLLPLGFLALLAPRALLICAPYVLLMFMSDKIRTMQLIEHYTVIMMPILFVSIIIGVRQIAPKWDKWLSGWLILFALIGFFYHSPAPFGGRYTPERFTANDHQRAGIAMARRVPEEIDLLAHTAYTPHLTHVNGLDVFLDFHEGAPFDQPRLDGADYIFIDRNVAQPELGLFEVEHVTQNLLADPDYLIVQENDGIFFLQRHGTPHPAVVTDTTFDQTMRLTKVEIAVIDEDGFFVPQAQPYTAEAGQRLRVSLIWESLSSDVGARTVSLRLSAADGFLIAQHDSIPAEALRPTEFWQTGEQFRDVRYLQIPDGRGAETLSLDLVVYDTFTQALVTTETGDDMTPITPITLR